MKAWAVISIILAVIALIVGISVSIYFAFREKPSKPSTRTTCLDLARCLNDTTAKYALKQYVPSRASFSNNVLTIVMQPSDVDANDGKVDRQRNEIRIKDPAFCVGAPGAGAGKSGVYSMYVRVDAHGNWIVTGESFYHFVQIKSPNHSRMFFSLGLKNSHLSVYAFDKKDNTSLWNIANVTSKWVHLQVSVVAEKLAKMSIEWVVVCDLGTKSGKYVCNASGADYFFLKLGQYRSKPNPVLVETSSSYKEVCFKTR
jgi:hypothetical protein